MPTVETVRLEYIIRLYMREQKNMLLVGNSGSGKSIFVRNLLSSLSEQVNPVYISLSGRTSAEMVQGAV